VYGTSGPRILLWFDFLDPVAGPQPMGSEVFLPSPEQTARFRVRASGSFEQQPGCPAYTRDRLSPERLERICRGECYHPGDRRHPIEAIEVVRIRPQTRVDEPIADLVDDPWKILDCPGKTPTCSVEFEDPDYDGSREFLYYVRALQAPTPVINGNPMDCQRDADGRCREARLCPAGGPGYDPTDECLSPARERAWSSPIWLRPEAGPGSAGS